MPTIDSIMTHNPVFVSQHANVHKARMLMAEKKIRHLPVKSVDDGRLIGMVSQKAILKNAIKIINQRGFDQLEHTEKSMDVQSIMEDSLDVFEVSADVIEVARNLLNKRSGCIPVEEKGKLVGVVTSADFVKLAVEQLS
ncbi:MAG: CBS domain-containing protein [Kangiellaceae bacterium]|nr:CBS domain-containing protein [Kangiellaceae bacterium]